MKENGIQRNMREKYEMQILLMHAVEAVLANCGNSYSNAYTQAWLNKAKEFGAYKGSTVGTIADLTSAWSEHSEDLPDIPPLKEEPN